MCLLNTLIFVSCNKNIFGHLIGIHIVQLLCINWSRNCLVREIIIGQKQKPARNDAENPVRMVIIYLHIFLLIFYYQSHYLLITLNVNRMITLITIKTISLSIMRIYLLKSDQELVWTCIWFNFILIYDKFAKIIFLPFHQLFMTGKKFTRIKVLQ